MARYSPVYSVPLILYTEDAANTSFDVPAGMTAVVRQVNVVQSAGAYNFGLYIADSDIAPEVQVLADVSGGTFNTYTASGRWVVNEGGHIRIYVSTILDSLNVYVGGYLLTNTLA